MKKVLIIINTGFVSFGGLATVMMNYYSHMELDGLIIDFASNNEPDYKILQELRNGSKYYNLGARCRIFSYTLNLYNLIKEKGYDVVHVNGNSATMLLELAVAKVLGVRKRIAHVHASKSGHPILHSILSPFFKEMYTDAIAVSKMAGDWLYGDNYIVLNNAIDTYKYAYNEDIRNRLKKELNCNEEFVIGNIGKLTDMKNQTFLLDIFAEYIKINKHSKLLIGGGGDLENELVDKAKHLGIQNEVVFLGMLSNVEEILQVFDCFLFTSKYEGLGMVLIEAQASGLMCLSSSSVPKETKVTNNIEYIDLEAPITQWIKQIELIRKRKLDRSVLSKDARASIRRNGYYINDQVDALRDIYLE